MARPDWRQAPPTALPSASCLAALAAASSMPSLLSSWSQPESPKLRARAAPNATIAFIFFLFSRRLSRQREQRPDLILPGGRGRFGGVRGGEFRRLPLGSIPINGPGIGPIRAYNGIPPPPFTAGRAPPGKICPPGPPGAQGPPLLKWLQLWPYF